jgi:thiol-disulfide isomerase/thioredoxin
MEPKDPASEEEVVLRQADGPVEDKNRPKKRFNIPFWGKVFIMSGFVFLASIGYLRSYHDHAENAVDIQGGPSDVPSPEKRKQVPDIFMVAGPGSNKKLSDFRGKVVLLSFWASWCTPCLVELPTFIDLHEKLADKGLVIIPLNVDEPDTAAKFVTDFWKARKFPFATFYDPTHDASDKFHIESLPSNFVLDKQGRLVAQGYGANDWGSEDSVKFIEQLLSEEIK